MRYHNITKYDMLNGSGLRVVLWVAGCSHHCPGCQNPITHDPNGGIPFDEKAKEELFAELRKDVRKIEELKNQGSLIQVNASSIIGEQGFGTKLFVKKLLKSELIDFVGTDAHHYEKRAPHMEKCANYLVSKVSAEYASAILYKNAFECFGIS